MPRHIHIKVTDARRQAASALLQKNRTAWANAWVRMAIKHNIALAQAKRDYFIQGMAVGCLTVVLAWLTGWQW